MASYGSSATLTTGAGTLTFNAASGDTYWNDPTQCAGLDMAPVRATVDDKPQTDGGIIHTSFLGARHITLGGVLLVRSATTEATYLSARAALEHSLVTALTAIMNVDGTYSWDDAGTTRNVTVRCDQAAVINGTWTKAYVLGLVAADPTIS